MLVYGGVMDGEWWLIDSNICCADRVVDDVVRSSLLSSVVSSFSSEYSEIQRLSLVACLLPLALWCDVKRENGNSLNYVILIGSVVSVQYVQHFKVVSVLYEQYTYKYPSKNIKIKAPWKSNINNKRALTLLQSFILAKCTIPPYPFWILTHDSYQECRLLQMMTYTCTASWMNESITLRYGWGTVQHGSRLTRSLSTLPLLTRIISLLVEWMNESIESSSNEGIFNKSGGGQTVALSRHQHDAYLRPARAARNERMNVPVKSINNNHWQQLTTPYGTSSITIPRSNLTRSWFKNSNSIDLLASSSSLHYVLML